jgi:hypothetical protein
MSQLSKQWEADAQTLGIPENELRGLAFLLAGKMTLVQTDPSNDSETQQLFERMNLFTTVHPEPEIEFDFNENRIVGIMLKVAKTFNSDFKPREISLTSGNSIPAFSSDADITLPRIGEDRQSMAHFIEFAQQVAKQIGECIDGGLEAAYASGHHFVTSYGQMDTQGIINMFHPLLHAAPPHYGYFLKSVDLGFDYLIGSDPIQKVYGEFLAGSPQPACQLAWVFSDRIHYQGQGIRREAVWSADFNAFSRFAIQSARALVQATDEVQIQQLTKQARPVFESFLDLPSEPFELDEAVEYVSAMLQEKWGLSEAPDSEATSVAETYIRRSGIMFTAIGLASQDPDWATV